MRKRLIKLLIFAAIFFWLIHGIDPDELLKALKNLKPSGIALTFLAIFFSDLVISFRWYYLSHFKHSFISSLEANMLAFFLNIFAPAKLGDLAKIYYMHKKDSHDPKHSSSIFLIERFFDVVILASIIAFAALFIIPNRSALFVSFVLFCIVIASLFVIFHRSTLHLLLRVIKIKRLRRTIFLVAKAMQTNLTPRRVAITFLLSLAVWASYYLNNFIFFMFATDFHLSLQQIFIASTLAFAVSAIPLTPGGIGTFQAAFIITLGWYGIGKEEALGASTILQILYILPATLYSTYLFLTKDFLWERRSVSAKNI